MSLPAKDIYDCDNSSASQPAQNYPEEVDSLQQEVASLKQEVMVLRRRDETLRFYMQQLDEELRLAARLQQDFLPKSIPQIGQICFHAFFRPAGYVSGDLYDVMRLDESHMGFYIADAVGHGMPAALLAMFLKRALVTKEILARGYRLLPPGESLSRLNVSLTEQNLSQATFATALYGMIDVKSFEITVAKGGHPSPILISPGKPLKPIDSEGGLLGIFPHAEFETVSAQLAPGDRLFIYTDGIEVAYSDDLKTNAQQWVAELEKRRDLPIEQLFQELSHNMDKEVGSLQPKDDLTMIIMEIKPNQLEAAKA